MPFLVFFLNGSLAAQIYSGSIISVVAPSVSLPTSIWSHVVQTWSSTNGLRLYINNVLVASLTSATTYSASGSPMFLTLANTLNGASFCYMGQLNSSAYKGDMDDFRVYSRELSAGDICTLYTN
jgi:hypothetical protein